MTQSRVKAWVWVAIGIAAFGIICVILLAAVGIWVLHTHVNIQPTTVAAAMSDLQTIRDRFASQKPLIELDDRGNFVHANIDRPAGTQRPETLSVMAFDREGERVVRVEIPFWLLRLKTHGTMVDLGGGGDIDLAKLRLTVEDLERFGPTLILDHTDTNGSRVIVWSQ